MSFVSWWIAISYLVGFAIFCFEGRSFLKHGNYRIFGFSILLLVLAPLTAWHALLHYAQRTFCKITKRPVKFWL